MSVVYKDVLERFVKYREQRNISQNELAQMLCISQSYVSKMEVGKARISFDILTALYHRAGILTISLRDRRTTAPY